MRNPYSIFGRVYGLNPYIFCRKHLLLEHGSIHAQVKILLNGDQKKIQQLVDADFISPFEIAKQHTRIAAEMTRRKMNHQSHLLKQTIVQALRNCNPEMIQYAGIDQEKSIVDLILNCPECAKRYDTWQYEMNRRTA